MEGKADNIFLNSRVKTFIINGIPVMIAVLSVLASLNVFVQIVKVIFVFVIVVLTVFYLGAVYYYGKNEDDIQLQITNLECDIEHNKLYMKSIENKNKVMGHIIATFDELVEKYASSVNEIANDIKKSGRAERRDWNVPVLCGAICKSCCEMLKKETGVDNNIGVSFIHKYQKDDDKEYIKLIAHSSLDKPNVYMREELLASCVYYYASLIKENNPDIKAIADKEDVYHAFRKKNDKTDLRKYSQYIAYPIICDDNKIVGILQIVIKNDTKIRENDLELRNLAEAYIGPFARLIMLVCKLDKGLFAIPETVV